MYYIVSKEYKQIRSFWFYTNEKQRHDTIIYVYKRKMGRKQHPDLQCFCGSGTAGSCCNYLVVDRVHNQWTNGEGKDVYPSGVSVLASGDWVSDTASLHICSLARSTSTVAMYCTHGRFLTSVLNLGQNIALKFHHMEKHHHAP